MDFISLPRAQQFKMGRTIPWIQTKPLKFKLEKWISSLYRFSRSAKVLNKERGWRDIMTNAYSSSNHRKMVSSVVPRAQQFKTGRTIPWTQTKTLNVQTRKNGFQLSTARLGEN